MNKTVMFTLTCILAAHGWGCDDPDHGTTDAVDTAALETDTVVPEEEEESSGVVERKVPAEDLECTKDDDYYYETISYSSENRYLKTCVGYSPPYSTYTKCSVYNVWQVKNVYAVVGFCSEGVFVQKKYLKSANKTFTGYTVAADSTTGFYCPPLFGGFCY